jgi:RNA polymerase sigma-70 factor (ECF subfamily)
LNLNKDNITSELLNRFKKGDHTAFETIFERYSKQLYQFSFSYLKSEEAAEDIVQEVFIKIWNNRRELKTDTSFQSYLFTITLNSIRKYFNQLSRLNTLKHDILFDSTGLKPDFDDRSDYQFILDKMEELIRQMPEKRREVFVKKKIEEKSLKEISEELNITTKTVEYHITEAMKFLKSEFEKLQVQGLIFFHLFIR